MLCHTFFLLVHGLTALVGIGLLTAQASRSYSDTPESPGLLWMSDRHVAETSYLTTHNTQKRHPCPWWDSNHGHTAMVFH